jgi:hypothetical protein
VSQPLPTAKLIQDVELGATRRALHWAIARVDKSSYGTVLKAWDCHDGSIVAIKSIESDTATGRIRESAANEINTLMAVASPYVCRMLREPI